MPQVEVETENNGIETPTPVKATRGKAAKAEAPSGDPIVYVEVVAELAGLRPGLMMHPMDDATLDALYYRQGGSTSKGNEIPPMELTASNRMYRDPESERIAIPTQNLMASLIEAGRQIPYAGKMMLSNAGSSKVTGIVSFEDEFLPLEPNPEPNGPYPAEGLLWVTDKRRGQMDNGTTVCIVRPKFREWSVAVSFSLNLEGEPIGREKIKRCFEIAGKSVGLCSFRPQKKGSFGRFRIESWEEQCFTAKQLAARSVPTAK